MERIAPVNPERRVNLFVKILLYPQVTTFKVINAIPTLSDYRKNYQSRSFGFAIIIFTEIVIFDFFFPNANEIVFNRVLFVVFAYHLPLEIIFNKKIYEMGFDYYSYYNKALLYFFLIFLAVGLGGFCIFIYNRIGHL